MKRGKSFLEAGRAAAVCLLVLAAAAPAGAAAERPGSGYSFNEYTFSSPKAGPSVVMRAPDGAIWVALARVGKLARMKEGRIEEFPLLANSFPVGMAIDGDGRVWYSDIRRNKIGRLDAASGAVLEFDIPTRDSWPFFIVVHPDGHLWFTQRMGNNIARLDPRTGEVREFRVPTPNCQPAGMTVTPQGQIFFTENSGNKIGHFDPATERLVELAVPTPMTPSPFYGLAGIASDREGNIWFSEVDGRLGFLRRGTTEIQEIPLTNPAARPAGVIVDSWGLIWMTELDGNALSSYDPRTGRFRTYRIPTGTPDPKPMGPPEATARGELPAAGFAARTSRPFGIALDRDGRIWFSEQYAHKLGVLSPPPIEIFQPAGYVAGPVLSPEVQLRVPQRSSAPRFFIDGRPVPEGKISLADLTPGRHDFSVRVSGPGGELAAGSSFHLTPTPALLEEILRRGRAAGGIGPDLARRLQADLQLATESIRNGRTGLARDVWRSWIRLLSGSEKGVSRALAEHLLLHLRDLDLFARREYVVEVRPEPPYFSPARMEIEAGDAVTWVWRGSPSHDRPPLRLASRGGDFRSPSLAGGGSWTHVFRSEGQFDYADLERPEVGGTVAVSPRTTLMLEFPTPGPDRVPSVLTVDQQDNLWFTEGGGGFSKLAAVPLNNRIGRLSADGRITEFSTPTPESGPTSIAVDQEGVVWFTERAGNSIGGLDPRTGQVQEYPIPTPMSGATGITVDHHGRVWFAEKLSSKIGMLRPATREIVEYPTPTPKSQPSTVMVDASGLVWFDERANDRIVRLNPESGEMKEYQVPTPGSRVVGLVPDGRGRIWFLQLAGNKVGCLDVESGLVTEYAIPTRHASPFKLAVDGAGRVWFTEVFGNRVGVLTNGEFVEFAVPAPGVMPGGIAIDSQGNVWFAQQAANRIAMLPRAALGDAPPPEAPPQVPDQILLLLGEVRDRRSAGSR